MEITYIEDSSSANDALYYYTIIAKAFADALDQNECNLKVAIDITEDIKGNIKDGEDLIDLIENRPKTPYNPEGGGGGNGVETPYLPPDQIILNPTIANYLKQNCLDCDLGLPTIDLTGKLDWVWDRLKLLIDAYEKLFEDLLNPNDCHAIFAFQYTCLPDIIKLIAMLLSVYAAILALRKLSGISISVFIKGMISGLLGQIISNFNIQVDFSQTGIGCVINLLRELADMVPDGENLSRELSPAEMELIGIDPNQSLGAKKYIEQLRRQTNGLARGTSNIFKNISQTVDKATLDFNENLANMFNIFDYLQCESGRSGANFVEIADYIKELTNVINLLSSIAAIVAKKQVRDKLCTTDRIKSDLVDKVVGNPSEIYTPFTDLEVTEVLAEYLGKVVVMTEDENGELVPLIYDKKKDRLLPKLDLLTCNLKDFIDNHNIDKITPIIIDEIEEEERIKEKDRAGYDRDNPEDYRPRDYDLESVDITDYTRPSNNWGRYPLEYIKPPFKTPESGVGDIDQETLKDINTTIDNSLISILDFVYNNPLDKNKPKDKGTDKDESSLTPESNKDKPKASFINLGTNKDQFDSFDAKCREIEDILNQIKNT